VTLTRQHLADTLQERFNLPGREAERWVTFLLDEMTAAMAAGDPVAISGFGVFEVVERKPRIGRNPRTREAVPIPARRAVAFRPSEKLKLRLNPHRAVDGS
jgi:integration host factor subunit alpha